MSNKPKVLVDPFYRTMESVFSPADLTRLYEIADVVWGKDEKMPEDQAREAFKDAEAVIATDWRYGDALAQARELRGYISIGGNLPQDLDYEQCFRRNIRVLSCAPAFGPQVAEMALGLTLACSREICIGDKAMRESNEVYFANQNTFTLYNKPVGIIGYGGIGRALRPLLEAFGCDISVYDPWQTDGYIRSIGLKPVGLEELVQTSRVIYALAVPSTENEALLSRSVLEMIRPDAVLVLVSRAHIVDFEALTDLVLAKRFKAAIDVYPIEPFTKGHRVRGAEWAVLQAHRAGSVREALWEIGSMVVDDLDAILRGIPPQRMQVAQPELVFRYSPKGFHAGLA